MSKFKVGDQVNMTDPGADRSYKAFVNPGVVTRVHEDSDGDAFLHAIDAFGNKVTGAYSHRFTLISTEKPMSKFKVGDRVRVKDDYPHLNTICGKLGTVKEGDDKGIGLSVEMDDRFKGSHTCGGVVREGHGRYLDAPYLEAVSTSAPTPPLATKHWFICVLHSFADTPQPAPSPRLYTSEAQAKASALSMAEKNKGERFVVYEATEVFMVPKPVMPAVVSHKL